MYCGILETQNPTAQTLTAESLIAFTDNTLNIGTAVTHKEGDTTAYIRYKGIYCITFTGDIAPAATGPMTVNILNNGNVIATTTFTGATSDAVNICLTTLLNVLPSCPMVANTSNISVQVVEAATVNNPVLIIKRF